MTYSVFQSPTLGAGALQAFRASPGNWGRSLAQSASAAAVVPTQGGLTNPQVTAPHPELSGLNGRWAMLMAEGGAGILGVFKGAQTPPMQMLCQLDFC